MAFIQPPTAEQVESSTSQPPSAPSPSTNTRRAAALPIIKALFPDWDAERELLSPPKFGRDLDIIAADFCYGELWTRPGLSLRDRSLVSISILIGAKSFEELRFHFPAAIKNGLTTAEIDEVILHSAAYAGFPAAAEARKIAREVLGGMGLL